MFPLKLFFSPFFVFVFFLKIQTLISVFKLLILLVSASSKCYKLTNCIDFRFLLNYVCLYKVNINQYNQISFKFSLTNSVYK